MSYELSPDQNKNHHKRKRFELSDTPREIHIQTFCEFYSNRVRIIALVFSLFFLIPVSLFAGSKKKDCGPFPPGATFDSDCKIKPFPPPHLAQGDAEVITEVLDVKCGTKTNESQEYISTLAVKKILRGKVPREITLKFYRYFDEQVRLGDNGVSFLKGDQSKLILTKYKDYWAVQFPHHKEVIRSSGGMLPNCNSHHLQKTTSTKNVSEKSKLPKAIVNAVLQSGLMSRDSGKTLTVDFLNNCIKERLPTYIEFHCDDLLWPYYLKIFRGNTAQYIYFIEDGASVENRAFFRIDGENLIREPEPISTMITHEQVTKWLNKKFKTKQYTVALLEQIAHSHYRTQLPKKDGKLVTILSGEQSNSEHAYKPIGVVRWTGQTFQLVDP